MDILAGMLGYLAGIGAVFGALALSFFVFFATPKETLQAQSEPQSAHALLARRSASGRPQSRHMQGEAQKKAPRIPKDTSLSSPALWALTSGRELPEITSAKPAPQKLAPLRLKPCG